MRTRTKKAEKVTPEEVHTEQNEVNAYELQRQERIRQNKERMLALQLDTLASSLALHKKPSASKPTQRGISKRKRLSDSSTAAPPRRSGRIQGIASDGAHVLTEGRGGEITVAGVNGYPSSSISEPQAPRSRHPKTDLPFKSTGFHPKTDAAFVNLLAKASSLSYHEAVGVSALGLTRLKKFKLREEDVAKVTKEAITHLGFMPTANICLMAAADKRGNLGLWNVDYVAGEELGLSVGSEDEMDMGTNPTAMKEATISLGTPDVSTNDINSNSQNTNSQVEVEEDEDKDDGFDGVLSFALHYQYISGLKWAGGEGAHARLFTASYDGSLRVLDPSKEVFALAWGDEEMEYSCMDITPDGSTAYLADNEGSLDVIDLRTAQRVYKKPLEIHTRKINTVHVEPVNQRLLVTGSTDSSVHVWDVRKLGPKSKSVASGAHSASCQGAYFSPDGAARVVSTSFDNTVKIWDGSKAMKQLHSIRHENDTGRWVLPFRAVWNQQGDAVIVGNMHRYADIIGAESGKLEHQLSSEFMTAIPARNCVHPLLPILASATASGRVHLYR